MSEKKGYFRRFSEEGLKEIIFESFRSWLWPITLSGITVVLGYAQQLPLMYIFVGSVATFAFVTHGILKATEWKYVKTPEHKLDFLDFEFGANYDKDKPGKIIEFGLGVRLKSQYAFPMEVEIVSITSRFDNRVPTEKNDLKGKVINVSGRGECFFSDTPIDISNIDFKGKNIDASVEYTVRYGVPSKRIYKHSKSMNILMSFDNEGNYRNSSWSDSHI